MAGVRAAAPPIELGEPEFHTKQRGLWSQAFARLSRNRLALFSAVILITLTTLAVLSEAGTFVQHHDPAEQNYSRTAEGPSRDYWLGTDKLGRDLWSRLMQGLLFSLKLGIVAQIFGLIQQAITTINKELDEPWDIPLLSELYAQYVDDSLTPLSVMALAIALPADAVYFTAFDRHPFETDDDLTTFQKEFTAEWLWQQSQLVAPGTALPAAMPPELRLAVSKFLGTTLAASYVTLGVMNEALDLIAAGPVNQGPNQGANQGPLSSFQAAAVVAGWTRWASASRPSERPTRM